MATTLPRGKYKMNMERIMKDVTLEIKIIETPRFKFRKRWGIRIIRLGVIVLGCRLKVDE